MLGKDFKEQSKIIEDNWNRLRAFINETFPTRSVELNRMYDDFEDRMCLLPASGTEHYHNAFPGGYVDHILRVIEFSVAEYEHWKRMGLKVDNFSLEELKFAALHHDLGKVGFQGKHESYLPNPSDWHRKNQGKIYTHNPRTPFVLVPDMSLFLLQSYGIRMSFQEMLAIRTHDGVYDRANESYYFSSQVDSRPRTNINQILHNADFMAARFEFERWINHTNRPFFYSDEMLEIPVEAPVIQKSGPSKIEIAKDGMDAFEKMMGELEPKGK